jgi:hypothetical protein
VSVDLQALHSAKIIECNECKNIIEKIVSKSEPLTENRIGYYFCCDACGKKYPYMTITEQGQKLLKKIGRIKKDIKKFPGLTSSLHFSLRKLLVDYQKEIGNLYTEDEILR